MKDLLMHSSYHLCNHLPAEARKDSLCFIESHPFIVVFHYNTLGSLKGTLLNLRLLLVESASRKTTKQDMHSEGEAHLYGKH